MNFHRIHHRLYFSNTIVTVFPLHKRSFAGFELCIYFNFNIFGFALLFTRSDSQVTTLTELAAKCVASFIPFELVEHVFPPVPEQLQLRIAYWSFPDNEEDIRLYSCLANSSADEFHRGDQLYRNRAVKDPLQIGKTIPFGPLM